MFLLYNIAMGRPRGMKNTAMVNGRITAEQMEWLQARADELNGNLSAALRQTITDARLLEMARDDYQQLRAQHPEFAIPPTDDEAHTSRALQVILNLKIGDPEDLELRDEENADAD
jgi:hypothetical protein